MFEPAPLTLITALREVPLYLLAVLAHLPQPARRARLIAVSGLSPNTVARGLERLEAAGLARRAWANGGWVLEPRAWALLRPTLPPPSNGRPANPDDFILDPGPGPDPTAPLLNGEPAIPNESRFDPPAAAPRPNGRPAIPNESDFDTPAVAPRPNGRPAIPDESNFDLPAAAPRPNGRPAIPDESNFDPFDESNFDPFDESNFDHSLPRINGGGSVIHGSDQGSIPPPPESYPPSPPASLTSPVEAGGPMADTLKALDAAGIDEPIRSQLATLPHVNAGYVRAHAVQARRDGGSLGLLVYRLRHCWRKPYVDPRTAAEFQLLYGPPPPPESAAAGDPGPIGHGPTQRPLALPTALGHGARGGPGVGRGLWGGQGDDAEPYAPEPPRPAAPLPPEIERAWGQALHEMEFTLGRSSFDLRLDPLRLIGYEPETHCFGVWSPDRWNKGYVATHLRPALERALSGITGRCPARVRLVSPDDEAEPAGGAEAGQEVGTP